jgi:tRNA (mo5U34)-methyltransferase
MVNKRDKLLTKPVKRRMSVRMGPVDMGIAVDPRTADSMKKSVPYRYFIKPALRRLSGTNGNGRHHSVTTTGDYRAGFVAAQPAPVKAPDTPEARKLLEKIGGYEWYHTIELGHGVATPGYVDHRQQLKYYRLPEDMTGMRVLDVATFDGFWAFEFERRGAEVVAIDVGSLRQTDIPKNWVDVVEKKMDLDAPKGRGFQIAHEILGSKVQKEVCSVYEISPERLGRFDMAFCSDLLIHIREPLAAMEAIWTVTDKFAIFADVYHPELEAFDNALVEFCQAGQADLWWRPSTRAYKLWLQVARFSRVEEVSRFVLEAKFRSEIPKVVLHAYR